jgi:hypothetical protein
MENRHSLVTLSYISAGRENSTEQRDQEEEKCYTFPIREKFYLLKGLEPHVPASLKLLVTLLLL